MNIDKSMLDFTVYPIVTAVAAVSAIVCSGYCMYIFINRSMNLSLGSSALTGAALA